MRALSAMVAFGLIFGGAATADEREELPLGAGHGALLFTLGGLFSAAPSALDGVGIGGRYFMQDNLAIRAGVGLSFAGSERDVEGPGQKSETDTSRIAAEAALEYTLFRRGPVYIFAGGLAQVISASTDEKDVRETSSFGFAVAGVVGANYFFDDSVSLGAEYRLGLEQVSGEEEPENGPKTETTNSRIGTGTVGFHLGFWF